ncbi:hypothetical protein [Yoonia sp. 208BN28-4]|uniref:hypothetical protein n=1 Tax=Yoonia sp. 208BN28-4 TaxID=3126505 RepID=UPI0030A07103
MNDFLPEAVRKGLEGARKASLKLNTKLCVHDGNDVYRIVRMWDDGFALDSGVADKLRGRVEIYDGVRHLYQCLVIGSEAQGAEQVFEFKWLHPVSDRAPVDFVQDTFQPAGLIAR